MQIEPLFHKNINFEPEDDEERNKEFRLIKFEWDLNSEEGYDSHINICFESKNKGEYFIYVMLHSRKTLRFFVKIVGEKERCLFGKFKIISENLKNFFEELKEFFHVFAVKTSETNFEDGKMDFIELANSRLNLFNGTNLLGLGPLFDDGSYGIYFDKNGKINDFLLSNRMLLKNSKNILKDYLNKRELGDKKNVFNKDEQIWFRYLGDESQNIFKNENGKYKIIEVYKFWWKI
ncbi:unnamed protein product [Meloidogyne enterolobii]|uniref:Uncharacterized protein n=1 Tax=Meloidogyne enterolobii TaxID=390850 RepID=A0ACB0XPN6_MELEN